MSYILDALRRAEAERQRKRGPAAHSVLMPEPAASPADDPAAPPPRPAGAPVPAKAAWAGAIGVAVLAAVAVLLLGRTDPDTPPASAAGGGAERPAAPNAATGAGRVPRDDGRLAPDGIAAAPDGAARNRISDGGAPGPRPPSATAADEGHPAPANGMPGGAAPDAGAPQPAGTPPPLALPSPSIAPPPRAQQAAAPAPRLAPAPARALASPGAATVAPAGAAPATVPTPAPAGMPAASPTAAMTGAMATPPSTRTAQAASGPTASGRQIDTRLPALPEAVTRQLAISGSRYADDPAARLLIVNGQVVREGGQLAPGWVLERIQLRSAIVSQNGQRYELRY